MLFVLRENVHAYGLKIVLTSLVYLFSLMILYEGVYWNQIVNIIFVILISFKLLA
jgi:hypothetical protein